MILPPILFAHHFSSTPYLKQLIIQKPTVVPEQQVTVHSNIWDNVFEGMRITCLKDISFLINGHVESFKTILLLPTKPLQQAVLDVIISHDEDISIPLCWYEYQDTKKLFNPTSKLEHRLLDQYAGVHDIGELRELVLRKDNLVDHDASLKDFKEFDNLEYLYEVVESDFPISFSSGLFRRPVQPTTSESVTLDINNDMSLTFANNAPSDVLVEIANQPKPKKTIIKTISGVFRCLFRALMKPLKYFLSIIMYQPDWEAITRTRHIIWHYILQIQLYAKFKMLERTQRLYNWSDIPDFPTENIELDQTPLSQVLDKNKNTAEAEIYADVLVSDLSEKSDKLKLDNPEEHLSSEDQEKVHKIVTSIFDKINEIPELNDLGIKDKFKEASAKVKANKKWSISKIFSFIWGFIKPIFKMVWKLIKAVSAVVVTLFSALIPIFIDVHKGIMSIPLYIPFFTNWLQKRLTFTPKLIDFFLIPISIRINYYFRKNDVSFSEEDCNAILATRLPDVKLSSQLTMKWHYAISYAIWLFGAASMPFSFIYYIPGSSNLSPLWSIGPYISSILSFPFSLIKPQAFDETDLFVVGMFPTCLYFIPFYFLRPIPSLVLDSLTTMIYGIPHFIYAIKTIGERTIDDLPFKYQNKPRMLTMHNTVELTMALPLLCDIISDPWVVGGWIGYPVQFLLMGLSIYQAKIGIEMISKTMQWHSPYMHVYQPTIRRRGR